MLLPVPEQFITNIAGAAATAGTIGCGLGVGRVLDHRINASHVSALLDDNIWYQPTMVALDVMGVLGATVGAASGMLQAIRNLRRITGRPLKNILQGLNRQERKRLTEELIRQLNPGISNGAMKPMVKMGVYPKRFGNAQLGRALWGQLLDATSAALNYAGSLDSGMLSSALTEEEAPTPLFIGVAHSFETY